MRHLQMEYHVIKILKTVTLGNVVYVKNVTRQLTTV